MLKLGSSMAFPVLLFLLLGFANTGTLQAEDAAQRRLIKIGVIAPLTGGLAERGQDLTRLISILEPHWNRNSKKYRYEFLLDDGKCGAGNSSTTIVQKFIHVDDVKFLITGCSGETLQAAPIAQKEGVVTFAVLSTHQDVKKIGDYVFRTFVDIERGVENFAKYMKRKSGGKVAILTEENAFTFAIKEMLLRHLGDDLIFSDDFLSDTSDFNTLLLKMKSKGARAVYFNVVSEVTLAVLVNQSRALGLDFQIYSYVMPEAASFLEATGSNSEGLEFIGSPQVRNASAEFRNVRAEYQRKYPEGPSYEFLLRTFYDAAKAMIDGIEVVGPDPAQVRDYLTAYRSHGALGEVSFDENGDIANINYVLRRVSKGKVEYVGELLGPNSVS